MATTQDVYNLTGAAIRVVSAAQALTLTNNADLQQPLADAINALAALGTGGGSAADIQALQLAVSNLQTAVASNTSGVQSLTTSDALNRARALPLTPNSDVDIAAVNGYYNFDKKLNNLRKTVGAYGLARAGIQNFKVAFSGDSNTSGHGAGLSTEATGYTQAANRNITNTFARIMNQGNPIMSELTPTLNLTQAQWALPFDRRATVPTQWGPATAVDPTFGGYLWTATNANTGLVPIKFKPEIAYNQVDVWSVVNNAGLANLNVTQGGAALGTINSTNATASFTKTQYATLNSGALVTDEIAVAQATAATAYLGRIVTRDTTRVGTEVHNLAFDGGRATVNFNFTGQVWSHGNAVKALAPDLIVLQLGINDINQAGTSAAFVAAMTTLINTYRGTLTNGIYSGADVIVCTWFPIAVGAVGGTNNTAVRNADFFNAIYTMCKNLNVPLIDHTLRMGGLNNFPALQAAGYTFDNNHLTAKGYAAQASAVAHAIQALA